MTNIINLMSQYGKVTIDIMEMTVNCTTYSNYTKCINKLMNAGYIINSVDTMDEVITFIADNILIQVNAPYGDDI